MEQLPPCPQVLQRGKAQSAHSSVALSTGRLLASHSNLSPALNKVNKLYGQGDSDCSPAWARRRRVEIFIYNRKTHLLLLPLPWSKHLPLTETVFLCFTLAFQPVSWLKWHKNLNENKWFYLTPQHCPKKQFMKVPWAHSYPYEHAQSSSQSAWHNTRSYVSILCKCKIFKCWCIKLVCPNLLIEQRGHIKNFSPKWVKSLPSQMTQILLS